MISDSEIIKGCIKGDKNCQQLLYKKYASTMLGICCRYFRTRDEAEDVLQEGFIKVFMNLDKYDNKGSFEGWIKRIMVNMAIDNYHNNQKHYFHSDIQEMEEYMLDEKTLNDSLSEADLLKMVQEIPEGYRVIFNLYAIEGYSHKEIAELLNISESTSKSQLSRARIFLQKRLVELNKEKKIKEIVLS